MFISWRRCGRLGAWRRTDEYNIREIDRIGAAFGFVPMTSIVVPKLIAVDTSTLIGLADDLSSPEPDRRRVGESFVRDLSARGWLPVVLFENVMEMLRHGNPQTVSDRISLFAGFRQVAHVDSFRSRGTPGTIVDILAREVRVFLSNKTSDVFSIAASVRGSLFGFCDGTKITNWLRQQVANLRPQVQHSHPREKLLSSISHIAAAGKDATRLGTFRADSRMDREGIERYLEDMQRDLETQFSSRGVSGVDCEDFVENFVRRVRATYLASAAPDGSCAFSDLIDNLLRNNGIDAALVSDKTTVREIALLVGFNDKLKVASDALGLSQPVVASDIPIDKCPSEIVQSGLQRLRTSGALRAQAGDLVDSHLATLACYCDLTIVDKRTKTYLNQFKGQDQTAAKLIGKVVSLSKYTDVLREDLGQ